MKWIKKQHTQTTVVNPDLVKVRPKPALAVMEPEVVKKKRRAEKVLVLPQEEIKTKRHGLHDDGIPAGTLCYLRKRAKERYGFEFCTVLRTHVSKHGNQAWADVLTPDGNIQTLDVMWLRNTTVENGNVVDEEGDSDGDGAQQQTTN